MNRINLMLGLLALLLVAIACNPSPTPNSDIVCDPAGCISLSTFSANIASKLNNGVVGYVSFVDTLPSVFSGQARTSADPPAMAMLPDIPTNVASTSKTLTTIAVLQSLANHNLTINDKISPYLWADWTKGPNIDTITFSDLLTRRAFESTAAGTKPLMPY